MAQAAPIPVFCSLAYIEETGCTIADYRQFYQQHRAELLRERRGGQVADHPEAIATTWSLAFQRIEQAQPAATDLLRLCAFLAPDAIPEELLIAGAAHLGPRLAPVAADSFRLNQAIEALRAYSLAQRDATSKTLTVPRLVQAVLQDAMTPEEQQAWRERMVQAVRAVFPEVEFAQWSAYERCLPHAQACLSLLKESTITLPHVAWVVAWLGWYLIERGRYQQAEAPLQEALAWRERHLGPEHSETAQSLNFLARLYERQGKYAEAEPLYKRALTIRQEQLGPTHPDTAQSLNNLAKLYRSQGKDEEAEPLYQRALAICEERLGPVHPHTRSTRGHYVGFLRALGRHAEADQVEARGMRRGDSQVE